MVFCGDPTMVSAEASCEFVPKGSPQKYEKTSQSRHKLFNSNCLYKF